MIKFEIMGLEICIERKLIIILLCLIGLSLCIIGYNIYSNKIRIIDSIDSEDSSNETSISKMLNADNKQSLEENDSTGVEKQAEYKKSTYDNITDIETQNNSSTNLSNLNISTAQGKEDTIKVYIVGCVVNPGRIFELPKGSIVADAIELAGGFTKEADIENINMVFELWENTTIKIFSTNTGTLETISTMQTNTDINKSESSSKNLGMKLITEFSAETGGGEIVSSSGASEFDKKININKATKEELMKLTGVGEKTAIAIIEYREAIGSYKSIEDIMNVKKIGEKTFDQIKEDICIK